MIENQDSGRLQKSANYAMWRFQTLQLEFTILLVEFKGLAEIAKNLSDHKSKNIRPLLDSDLRFEETFWKWSEQSARYYASAEGVKNIMREKVQQINDILENLKSDSESDGFQVDGRLNIAAETARWSAINLNFDNNLDLDFPEYVN